MTGEYQEIYGTGSEVLAPLQTRVLKFERKVILLEKQKENRNLRGEYIQRQIRGE